MANTVEIEAKSYKIAKVKMWATVITSLLSFAGMVIVAILQQFTADADSMDMLIKQLNDQVIPSLEEVVDKHTEELTKLRDRIVALETRLKILEDMGIYNIAGFLYAKTKTPKLDDNVPKPVENKKPKPTKTRKIPRLNIGE